MASIAQAALTRTTRAMLAASVGALIAIGACTAAYAAPNTVSAQIRSEAGELKRFYAQRDNHPLWLSERGDVSPAVDQLLERLESAQFDALDQRTLKRLRTDQVRRDLDRAMSGRPNSIAEADVELSRLFADYVRAMRAAPRAQMLYESQALAPVVPTAEAALQAPDARAIEERAIGDGVDREDHGGDAESEEEPGHGHSLGASGPAGAVRALREHRPTLAW